MNFPVLVCRGKTSKLNRPAHCGSMSFTGRKMHEKPSDPDSFNSAWRKMLREFSKFESNRVNRVFVWFDTTFWAIGTKWVGRWSKEWVCGTVCRIYIMWNIEIMWNSLSVPIVRMLFRTIIENTIDTCE